MKKRFILAKDVLNENEQLALTVKAETEEILIFI